MRKFAIVLILGVGAIFGLHQLFPNPLAAIAPTPVATHLEQLQNEHSPSVAPSVSADPNEQVRDVRTGELTPVGEFLKGIFG